MMLFILLNSLTNCDLVLCIGWMERCSVQLLCYTVVNKFAEKTY